MTKNQLILDAEDQSHKDVFVFAVD